jgi:hypothetical protein
VDGIVKGTLEDVKKSSLPERFKNWILGVFRNVSWIPMNRYDWWNDFSGATSVLLDKAMERLEEMGEPQGEAEPIYVSEMLLDSVHDLPEPAESPFSRFDDDEMQILWLFRRGFGNLWEWNIGQFSTLDVEERIPSQERDRAEEPLSRREWSILCDFFRKYDISDELLVELRNLYYLVGQEFAPHIVVGPLGHPHDDEPQEEKED